jgi:hypothetical protein
MLSVAIKSYYAECHYAECHYAECHGANQKDQSFHDFLKTF